MDITDATTSASGTASFFNQVVIENPRLLANNSSVTTTEASTLYIKGAPVASTNQTITRAYALKVAGGNSYFGGGATFTDVVTAKQRHILNCGWYGSTTSTQYLPFAYGGTVDTTSSTNYLEFRPQVLISFLVQL